MPTPFSDRRPETAAPRDRPLSATGGLASPGVRRRHHRFDGVPPLRRSSRATASTSSRSTSSSPAARARGLGHRPGGRRRALSCGGRPCRPPARRRVTSWRPTGGPWTREPTGSSPSTCPRSSPAPGTPPGWPPRRSASTSSPSSTRGRPPWATGSRCSPPPGPPPPAADADAVARAARDGRARRGRSSSSTPSSTCAGGPDRRRGRRPRLGARGQAGAARPGRPGRPLEKVRTSARALNRLVQRASRPPGTARSRSRSTTSPPRSAPNGWPPSSATAARSLRELHVSELGAAIGAHVGPGAVGIVVAPFWQDPDEDDTDTAED